MSRINVFIGAVGLAIGAVIARVMRNPRLTIPRPTPTCDDPGAAGCGSNPRQCGMSQGIVFGPGGALAVFEECGAQPATWVTIEEDGERGLDAGSRAQLMFASSPEVEVRVKHHGSPGRIEAFDPGGAVTAVAVMAPTPNVVQTFTLRGPAISRIDVIPGSPTDRTVVLGWCH
jgi:hypothetical protein